MMAKPIDQSATLKLLTPWRRRFQWATSLVILLLPWLQPGGHSLLRVDVPSLSLYLFGQVLRIQELYLFLLFALVFGISFLLITLVSGRVWCGWACPQTTLNDLAEWGARKLKLKVIANRLQGDNWRKVVVQLYYLLLAALVAANLLWYFIEPQRFLRGLFQGQLSFGVWVTFLVITLLVYLDLALVRRLMCKDFCPYGRIQTSLVDPGTLTLQLPESEKPRCIKCNSCVRACPMGIDIRDGYQVECINCGSCLDACRQVMFKRQQPGLISYTFGVDNRGAKALWNPRTLVLSLALLTLLTVLFVAVINRAGATLEVALSHTATSRLLKDGQQVTFFNAWINNRGTTAQTYTLKARKQSGEWLSLKGQTTELNLAGGKNRQLDFVLVSPPDDKPYMVEFLLLDQQQKTIATTLAQLSPLVEEK